MPGHDISTQTPGGWIPYTPGWSGPTPPAIGNGTINGAYFVVGKALTFRIYILMGSTTTYGTGIYNFALPVGFTTVSDGQVGSAFGIDTGTAYKPGTFYITSGATSFTVVNQATATEWQSTVPHTWANTDVMVMNGTIQVV